MFFKYSTTSFDQEKFQTSLFTTKITTILSTLTWTRNLSIQQRNRKFVCLSSIIFRMAGTF